MSDWLTIAVSVVASTGIWSFVKFVASRFVSSRIDRSNQKALESYRHQLNLLSDQHKFNFQRWITDFNLYTQKRHEVYAELFRLILVAHGALTGIIGIRQVPSFDEYSRADMEKYLQQYGVVEGYVPKLLDSWETSRKTTIERVREYLTMIDFQKADKARYEAKNYFLMNSLYMSEASERLADEIFHNLVELHVVSETLIVEHVNDQSMNMQRLTLPKKLETLVLELKRLLRNEIAVGDYSQIPQ